MKPSKSLSKITITLDTFFKQQAKEFFTSCGYRVEAEHEMLKMPKRLDVLVIKTDSAAVNFEIFSYFSQFNLISYKSHGDRVRNSGYLRSVHIHQSLSERKSEGQLRQHFHNPDMLKHSEKIHHLPSGTFHGSESWSFCRQLRDV